MGNVETSQPLQAHRDVARRLARLRIIAQQVFASLETAFVVAQGLFEEEAYRIAPLSGDFRAVRPEDDKRSASDDRQVTKRRCSLWFNLFFHISYSQESEEGWRRSTQEPCLIWLRAWSSGL